MVGSGGGRVVVDRGRIGAGRVDGCVGARQQVGGGRVDGRGVGAPQNGGRVGAQQVTIGGGLGVDGGRVSARRVGGRVGAAAGRVLGGGRVGSGRVLDGQVGAGRQVGVGGRVLDPIRVVGGRRGQVGGRVAGRILGVDGGGRGGHHGGGRFGRGGEGRGGRGQGGGQPALTKHIGIGDFLHIGLDLAGFKTRQNGSVMTKKRRFKGHFGVTPESCSKIFDDLQTTHIDAARIAKADVDDFLMALFWMKSYPVEEEMAVKFEIDEKTSCKHIWNYVHAIAALKEQKIVWRDFDEEDEIAIATVDGVDFRIQEPQKFLSREWWSHKHNGPGLTYEIGISIHHQQVVWMNGPFRPRGGQDLANYRSPEGLKTKLPAGKKIIGDRIYRDPTVLIQNELDTPATKKFKGRALNRHETFNGRIKVFKILSECFRHGFDKHKDVFEAVCVLQQ